MSCSLQVTAIMSIINQMITAKTLLYCHNSTDIRVMVSLRAQAVAWSCGTPSQGATTPRSLSS